MARKCILFIGVAIADYAMKRCAGLWVDVSDPRAEEYSMEIATITVLIRVGIALLCGAVLGLERERLERAAGLRTHALVAVSSCLVMIVSAYGFADVISSTQVVLDPSRVAAQVVSGIGFLGAGVIIFRKNTISGLTTAASVWSAAAVGLACGGGLFGPAAIVTGAIIAIQVVLRFFEYRFFAHHNPSTVSVRMKRAPGRIAEVERLVLESGVPLRALRLRTGRGEDRIELVMGHAREAAVLRLVNRLGALDGIGSVMYRSMNGRSRSGEEREPGDATFDTADDGRSVA
jgi:putative Mg2+ transporter-C (MgtC) family protein